MDDISNPLVVEVFVIYEAPIVLSKQTKQLRTEVDTIIFHHSTTHLQRSVCCSCHRFLNPSSRQIGKRCSSRKKKLNEPESNEEIETKRKEKKILKLKW